MEKEREGVLSTAKEAIVVTAKTGLDAAATGLEVTKDAALTVAKAGADVAATGLEVTKDAAITAGAAVGGAVSSLAKRAKRAIRGKPKSKPATANKKPAARKSAAAPKKTSARKAPLKKPRRSAKKSARKTARGAKSRVTVSGTTKTTRTSTRGRASKKR